MTDRPADPAASPPANPTPTTLVIDLDGTLVDSVADLTAAMNRLLASLDLPKLHEATVRQLVGRGVARLVEWSLEAAGEAPNGQRLPELVRAFLDIYGRDPAQRTRPYPGVVETLQRWRAEGNRMAVCTNKPQVPSEKILQALELAPYFDAVAGGDRFSVKKPNGHHVTGTIDLAGGAQNRTVYIGDSQTDLDAARAAGVPVVLVNYGYSAQPVEKLGADAVVSSFTEIPALLPGLLGESRDA
jgi:phosphoglycolate phosphatase